jgi:hypothetical protein
MMLFMRRAIPDGSSANQKLTHCRLFWMEKLGLTA